MERVGALIEERHFQTGRISISAAHLMGGCGMGRSTRDSVTDAWGRVHGIPWLRVADSSLFPDALEINPYVTVMALADRTAQAAQADAGELLGGRVAPTTA
jgi:choline dehydrogenase-like flavoprotein